MNPFRKIQESVGNFGGRTTGSIKTNTLAGGLLTAITSINMVPKPFILVTGVLKSLQFLLNFMWYWKEKKRNKTLE